jgi:hypothetical protein
VFRICCTLLQRCHGGLLQQGHDGRVLVAPGRVESRVPILRVEEALGIRDRRCMACAVNMWTESGEPSDWQTGGLSSRPGEGRRAWAARRRREGVRETIEKEAFIAQHKAIHIILVFTLFTALPGTPASSSLVTSVVSPFSAAVWSASQSRTAMGLGGGVYVCVCVCVCLCMFVCVQGLRNTCCSVTKF